MSIAFAHLRLGLARYHLMVSLFRAKHFSDEHNLFNLCDGQRLV